MPLERIFYDGVSWDFSEYFDYIKEIANQLPPSLRAFASSLDSYSLHGNETLHDARVLSFVMAKSYDDKYSYSNTSIEISLIDQLFEGKIILKYEGVSKFIFNESGLAENGHADILLHEFSVVRAGVYKHQVVFDHGGELHIEFSGFSHSWSKLNS